MYDSTQPFEGIRAVLHRLTDAGLSWGVVTNKAERFALPLVRALRLGAEVVVGGDTTGHTKPHPAPLLEAAQRLNVQPQACLYVGDDVRDVMAGRAAGMATAVAAWGYLGPDAEIQRWRADLELARPDELLKHLHLA